MANCSYKSIARSHVIAVAKNYENWQHITKIGSHVKLLQIKNWTL